MDVKQAVEAAKVYVYDLFKDEGATDIGLEEIEDEGGYWKITIGFSRPWDRNIGSVLSGATSRTYKTILVNDEDGRVTSVKNRIFPKEQ